MVSHDNSMLDHLAHTNRMSVYSASNSITLAKPVVNFVTPDAQQYRFEVPRANDPCRTHENACPEDLRVTEVAEARLTFPRSSLTDELSNLDHVVHSENMATSTIAYLHQGFDDEWWQVPLSSSVDHQIEHTHLLSDQFSNKISTANRPILQRWIYETSNANITFAERLEKSNWDSSRMERF
jgi:hypothetical protein